MGIGDTLGAAREWRSAPPPRSAGRHRRRRAMAVPDARRHRASRAARRATRSSTAGTPPFPETTGYIIGTLLAYGSRTGDRSYAERALEMGDWEVEVQRDDGGVRKGC